MHRQRCAFLLLRGYRRYGAHLGADGERLVSAQTGTIWMQVLVRGQPVHASVAGTGQNAIERVPLWSAIHALEAERAGEQASRLR